MNVNKKEWNNWKWQYQNSKTNYNLNIITFGARITPYYENLIDWNDENCPIKKQAVPSKQEEINKIDYTSYGINIEDSLSEEQFSPVPNLIHRYPDRALLLVTNNCFMYCRFCTRKRVTGVECKKRNLDEAINYIEKNKDIRDVLLSGGDPLTMEDYEIEEILIKLRRIKHVEILRIGTRAPVVLPMRITDSLVLMLKKYQPIWVNTHFNHPKELTIEARIACHKIIDSGIPMCNQSVLLKGVNDNINIFQELCLELIQNRVRPYYLYQCDLGPGMDHFRTRVDIGINIIRQLMQSVTGFAIPTYVIDAPNGGGKIPVNLDYIKEKTKDKIILQNNKGQCFTYVEVLEE